MFEHISLSGTNGGKRKKSTDKSIGVVFARHIMTHLCVRQTALIITRGRKKNTVARLKIFANFQYRELSRRKLISRKRGINDSIGSGSRLCASELSRSFIRERIFRCTKYTRFTADV